uniref:Protein E6 n=4 Tax=Panthera leo persica papillomavirus 1 TaxID=2772508 RepID=A0A386N959_9PAPI|nr:E6 [Panthera leo persica papillomavirus 1]AYE19154.1 E6 [Panthera leo persica papillomavirus 1]AYE19166.1 E6 [Panthera leo persica papillomavirus 1]AYE19185.1 E6 [Panthera leo persica papillomavirus 1]
MARPSTVKGLCAATGAAFSDFLLPCTFCLRFLTSVEKGFFDACPLQLQWKRNSAFGCCLSCIRKCASVERSVFFERKLTDAELAVLLQKRDECFIRCGYCMKQLEASDKLRCCLAQELDVVRGRVRGVCSLCRLSVEV